MCCPAPLQVHFETLLRHFGDIQRLHAEAVVSRHAQRTNPLDVDEEFSLSQDGAIGAMTTPIVNGAAGGVSTASGVSGRPFAGRATTAPSMDASSATTTTAGTGAADSLVSLCYHSSSWCRPHRLQRGSAPHRRTGVRRSQRAPASQLRPRDQQVARASPHCPHFRRRQPVRRRQCREMEPMEPRKASTTGPAADVSPGLGFGGELLVIWKRGCLGVSVGLCRLAIS